MSEPRTDAHRAQSLGAWKAGRQMFAVVGSVGSGGFDEWYNKTYPAPVPPEPPKGSVRGSVSGPCVWVRSGSGIWARPGCGSALFWVDALDAGLDPARIYVEIPDPATVSMSSEFVRAIAETTPGPIFGVIRATLTELRRGA